MKKLAQGLTAFLAVIAFSVWTVSAFTVPQPLENFYVADYANAIKAGEEVVKLADEGVYELLADMESIYMETNEYNKESIFEASFSKDQQNWKTRYFGTVEGGFCRGEIYTTHFNPTANLRDAYALIDGNPIGKDVNSLYDAAAY